MPEYDAQAWRRAALPLLVVAATDATPKEEDKSLRKDKKPEDKPAVKQEKAEKPEKKKK